VFETVYKFSNILQQEQVTRNVSYLLRNVAMQNDGPQNISTGMKSLMKLLNSYEEGFDGDNDNQEILEPLVNQIGNTVDKTSRDYIWNNGSVAASGHQDTIETVAGDIKETIRALQNELKTKSTQVTELKTIMARKKLSKENDLRNMKEDCEKREESLQQEFEKVRVQSVYNNPVAPMTRIGGLTIAPSFSYRKSKCYNAKLKRIKNPYLICIEKRSVSKSRANTLSRKYLVFAGN
jgi:hypothetical protein